MLLLYYSIHERMKMGSEFSKSLVHLDIVSSSYSDWDVPFSCFFTCFKCFSHSNKITNCITNKVNSSQMPSGLTFVHVNYCTNTYEQQTCCQKPESDYRYVLTSKYPKSSVPGLLVLILLLLSTAKMSHFRLSCWQELFLMFNFSSWKDNLF